MTGRPRVISHRRIKAARLVLARLDGPGRLGNMPAAWAGREDRLAKQVSFLIIEHEKSWLIEPDGALLPIRLLKRTWVRPWR